MLRDIGAAEDAVQEAFARLAGADLGRIRDQRGWLIVVTGRICLDQLGAARTRHERSHDPADVDTLTRASVASAPDPADRITLDDDVRAALRVVLERMSPAERVTFVLHDVFDLPFGVVADAVGRPVATCRQLAHRARLAVRTDGVRRFAVDPAEHRRVAQEFVQACANGDVSGLLPLLDPSVWGEVNLGPGDPRTGVVVHGPDRVAHNLLRYFGEWTTLVEDPVATRPALLAFVARRPYATIALEIADGRIRTIRVQVAPAARALSRSRLAPPAPSARRRRLRTACPAPGETIR